MKVTTEFFTQPNIWDDEIHHTMIDSYNNSHISHSPDSPVSDRQYNYIVTSAFKHNDYDSEIHLFGVRVDKNGNWLYKGSEIYICLASQLGTFGYWGHFSTPDA